MTHTYGIGAGTLAILGTLCFALPARAAEDRVVREYSFDLSEIEEVEFHASVGTLRIVPTEGRELKLVLEIEGQDRGWFRDEADVSDVELESRVRSDRLILEQTADDTNTEWTVELPVVARTSIEMGVGEIDAELGATALDIELGVGDVDVSLPNSSTGEVDLSVGVGDARLRGGVEERQNRSFVSQDVSGHGAGELRVRIETGVGDIDLTLE